jgi:ABC-2 type transport system permease protein
MGARLPNLREPSPSKIAAGFGGTLNLILNMVFIIAVVFATAIPSYYWVEGPPGAWQRSDGGSWWSLLSPWIGLGTTGSVVLGVFITLALGILGTYIPLAIGIKAFEKLEP